MNLSRSLICLLVAAMSAAAQAPAPLPPLPPQAPEPPQAPQAAQAPQPAKPARPPRALQGNSFNFDTGAGIGAGIGGGIGYGAGNGFAFAQPKAVTFYGNGNEDGLYQRAQTALDNHRWQEALDGFTEVVARGGTRAEGALYWKAYALNKLGRRDDALAAIADLRKSYASSRWLDDARVLEMEIRQASGQAVTPENESDEELKLLALNGLMQSDPDRALPLVENVLKGNQSPKLKKNAVYVIAQSSSPRAQQLLEQVARGSVNPDLQIVAIRYLSQQKRNQGTAGPLLWEVYNATPDVNVKREILSGLSASQDKDHLLQVAKTEKSSELRLMAIQRLGGNVNGGVTGGSDTLVSLYGSETDAQVKQAIVNTLSSQRNAKALVSLARAERDPQMKRTIVQHLVNMKSPDATDYLMEILK